MTHPIDIVIPWVDGADPKWLAARKNYRPDHNEDADEARYRDWDVFQYWFRSVELYAPWVRKIHLVTFGHLPPWLNTDHPKLRIVRHEDYIPEKYLPTFSSHVLELNLHRIPDLAEHFLYFNDDVYLAGNCRPEDFFRDGVPCDSAVLGVIKNSDTDNFMPYIMLNMMGMINKYFSARKVMKTHFSKWFAPCYGKYVLSNLYLSPWSRFTGFRNFHNCAAFCKSTFEEVWERFPEMLDRTCRNRFRSKEDVNQYLFRYWQLVNGNFVPKRPDSAYLTIGSEDIASAEKVFRDKKYRVVCINDDPMGFDFATEQKKLTDLLERQFPQPSSFELTY